MELGMAIFGGILLFGIFILFLMTIQHNQYESIFCDVVTCIIGALLLILVTEVTIYPLSEKQDMERKVEINKTESITVGGKIYTRMK